MQLELPFLRAEPPVSGDPPAVRTGGDVQTGAPPRGEASAIQFVRERRARKYIIRVRPDGAIRVTIPRGGSRRDAEAFVAKHRQWAERERQRVAREHAPVEWRAGHAILLAGLTVRLEVGFDAQGPVLAVGTERVRLGAGVADLRPAAEQALKRIARRELEPQLRRLAERHGVKVGRVTIRNQRSRWGSCSRTGAIALNFRLVQLPPAVCEYVLLHELMHVRQQNHSRRYWRLVEEVCPGFRAAERWLRTEGRSLF